MRDHKKLKVWQKAHHLAMEVYRETRSFPSDERFGITSQMRRASISIPTNIAEGCGRYGDAELARFISISSGSTAELEYLLFAASDLGYLGQLEHNRLDVLVTEVKRMLTAFHSTLTISRRSADDRRRSGLKAEG